MTRLHRLAAVLLALSVGAAACGAAGDEQVEAQIAQDEAGGPEFGDSLSEYLEASPPESAEPTTEPASSAIPSGFEEIEWETLIPPGLTGADISARYTERLDALEPDSEEIHAVYAEMQAEFDLINGEVNGDLAGDAIQLVGFVAPLTFSGDVITEFLLVPYFGACIHVPPPPANQTIMVTLAEDQGLSFDDSWGPVWVTGTLNAEASTTDIGTAGYSITGAQTGVYDAY